MLVCSMLVGWGRTYWRSWSWSSNHGLFGLPETSHYEVAIKCKRVHRCIRTASFGDPTPFFLLPVRVRGFVAAVVVVVVAPGTTANLMMRLFHEGVGPG